MQSQERWLVLGHNIDREPAEATVEPHPTSGSSSFSLPRSSRVATSGEGCAWVHVWILFFTSLFPLKIQAEESV